jgi:hypothetical protein
MLNSKLRVVLSFSLSPTFTTLMISSVRLPYLLLKSRPHPHLQASLAASPVNVISRGSIVAATQDTNSTQGN